MKTTLKKIKDAIMKQIKAYEIYPSKNKFDDGYLAGMQFILNIIEKDGRYKNKKLEAKWCLWRSKQWMKPNLN